MVAVDFLAQLRDADGENDLDPAVAGPDRGGAADFREAHNSLNPADRASMIDVRRVAAHESEREERGGEGHGF